MEPYLTVKEVAKLKGVTTKAVYMAINSGRLMAYRDAGVIKIFKGDFQRYEDMKWDRSLTVFEGERVYNEKRGLISLEQASEMIEVCRQKLYYAIRKGTLRADRKGGCYVIDVKDLFDYKRSVSNKKLNRNAAS